MIEMTLKRSLFAVALASGIVSGCGDVSDGSPTPGATETPTVTAMFVPSIQCTAGGTETEDVLYLGLDSDTKLASVTVEIYDWGYGDCGDGGPDCWDEAHTLELFDYDDVGADFYEYWERELAMAVSSSGTLSGNDQVADESSIFKCAIAEDAATTYVYTITVDETLEETCLTFGGHSDVWAPADCQTYTAN